MELDDIKKIWKKQDISLNSNLKIDEQALLLMNKRKAGSEFQKLIRYELVSLCSSFVILILLLFFLLFNSVDIRLFFTSVIAVFVTCIYLFFSLKKFLGFKLLNKQNVSVINMQKELIAQKFRMLKYRKIEFFLVPFLILSIFPPFYKGFYNINIFLNINLYITITVISFIISIPLIIWFNKIFYDRRIKKAEEFLNTIQEFERDTGV